MKLRMLALLAVLAIAFTAAPALAGPPHSPRHAPPRHTPPRYGWKGPHRMPPPPPPVHRHYRPPVYVGPRVIPAPPVYRYGYGYGYPVPYYYEPGVSIGVARGGFGLHIEF